MLSREENDLLTRVEGEAPMGQMIRSYWLPALLSSELEPGGAPRRLRLLGENLVAFRDNDGQVGILDEYCPHRGASLALARNENCSLQCIYHGWRVDVRGNIVDTPTEPEDSSFKERIKHLAYTTTEAGGFVWAYLGTSGETPPFPTFEWIGLSDEARMVIKIREECNWVQCLEGVIDSAHSNYLHSGSILPSAAASKVDGASTYKADGTLDRPSDDGRPKLEAQNTAYGFRYAAIRKPLAEPDKYKYVRTTLFVAPFFAFFPAPPGWGHMQAFVPIDDTHTMFYFLKFKLDGSAIDAATRREHLDRAGARPGIDFDTNYNKIRNMENMWLQDREAMQSGRSFSGLTGVQNEDIAVQESMGPIFDRSREHLGQTDVAVIRMRRLMLDSVRNFGNGNPPLGLREPVPYGSLRAEERIIPIELPWESVGAFAGEYVPA